MDNRHSVMTTQEIAEKVMALAQACNVTIVTAESCTAGAVALALSKAPGAGFNLHGGFITYTKEMKTRMLGVPASLLREKSAVAREVAEAMAKGACERSPADIAIAVTGVAGPEPDEDGNPVGLVYCSSYSQKAGALTDRYFFSGHGHDDVIKAAVEASLKLLHRTCG